MKSNDFINIESWADSTKPVTLTSILKRTNIFKTLVYKIRWPLKTNLIDLGHIVHWNYSSTHHSYFYFISKVSFIVPSSNCFILRGENTCSCFSFYVWTYVFKYAWYCLWFNVLRFYKYYKLMCWDSIGIIIIKILWYTVLYCCKTYELTNFMLTKFSVYSQVIKIFPEHAFGSLICIH